MLATQLELFDNPVNVKVVEKNGLTLFRCDLDFNRWITPNTPCPMCHPSTETAVCDDCGSAFEDDRYMLEHMRIGGQVQCDLCLPRATVDDCRDPNDLACEVEEIRLDREARRQAAERLRAAFTVSDDA